MITIPSLSLVPAKITKFLFHFIQVEQVYNAEDTSAEQETVHEEVFEEEMPVHSTKQPITGRSAGKETKCQKKKNKKLFCKRQYHVWRPPRIPQTMQEMKMQYLGGT